MSLDIVKWIKGWRLDKVFSNVKKFMANTAVSITEAIKSATEGTLLTNLATIADEALGTHLIEDGVKVVHDLTIKLLAIELGIEGLPDNPTAEDIAAFEKLVIETIAGKSVYDKSKFYTTFAAQVFKIISDTLQSHTSLTFADITSIVERCYQQYLADKENPDLNN